MTKANLAKSNLSKENGLNANMKTSQESLNSNKSDLMTSILKDWEASKTAEISAGPHKARVGQIKRELSDVKPESIQSKKTVSRSSRSGSSPDSDRSGDKPGGLPATGSSQRGGLAKRNQSATAMAAQLKRASANKKETSVTKVTTTTMSSNNNSVSKKCDTKVTKKEEVKKESSSVSSTTQKVVSIRGGGGAKKQADLSKRETWYEGAGKDSPGQKHKEAMEGLKSSLTKALFLEKKEETAKPSAEVKSSAITVNKLDVKGKLALSDLQNQNYIDSSSTSAESSETEVEKAS